MIRIHQKPPKGLPRKLHEFVKVAGIPHPPATARAEGLIAGTTRHVWLNRSLSKKYGPNAIEVVASWVDSNRAKCEGRVGWIPKALAARIAKDDPDTLIGATLKVMYRPEGRKSAGIRIDVWGQRRKKNA